MLLLHGVLGALGAPVQPQQPPPASAAAQLQVLEAPARFLLWIIFSSTQTRLTSVFLQVCSLPHGSSSPCTLPVRESRVLVLGDTRGAKGPSFPPQELPLCVLQQRSSKPHQAGEV